MWELPWDVTPKAPWYWRYTSVKSFPPMPVECSRVYTKHKRGEGTFYFFCCSSTHPLKLPACMTVSTWVSFVPLKIPPLLSSCLSTSLSTQRVKAHAHPPIARVWTKFFLATVVSYLLVWKCQVSLYWRVRHTSALYVKCPGIAFDVNWHYINKSELSSTPAGITRQASSFYWS